jgi:hypothetical protein
MTAPRGTSIRSGSGPRICSAETGRLIETGLDDSDGQRRPGRDSYAEAALGVGQHAGDVRTSRHHVGARMRQRSAIAGVDQDASQSQRECARGWCGLLREHRSSCAGEEEGQKYASHHGLVDSDAYLTTAAGWQRSSGVFKAANPFD